ncbi:unnamed protein product [Rangifer tarandus platyrhynchus]|uniref:Uncharacterized protein n=1 Tax=Rangifer tarandus platyrhynchus TaxID=3082113 RepID=A0ABN8YKB6_RANTA|nr:unnamed protein product [Rangifer tarandus platyrhynchus]
MRRPRPCLSSLTPKQDTRNRDSQQHRLLKPRSGSQRAPRLYENQRAAVSLTRLCTAVVTQVPRAVLTRQEVGTEPNTRVSVSEASSTVDGM